MKIKTVIALAALVVAATALGIVLGTKETVEPSAADNGGTDVGIQYKGHVLVEKYDARLGKWILVADKDNLLVDNGKEYIKKQIGNDTSLASNSTKYISLSNDATVNAGLTRLVSENTTGGLARALATYASNGTGAWNYTKTFTATATGSVQTTGLSFEGTPNADGSLFAAIAFTQANLLADDQLRIVWSISVS